MVVTRDTEHAHFGAEAATNHVLVYVDWDVIRAWEREEASKAKGERKKVRPQLPYVYGSGNSTFRSYVESGAVIWVWTCPEYAEEPRVHRLPPSLVARLHVMEAVPWKSQDDPSRSPRIPAWFPEKWKWVGIACPQCSVYLPVNNVYEHLAELTSKNKKGDEKPILPEGGLPVSQDHSPYYSLPSRVRFPKRLGDSGVSDLDAHARAVESRRTVFVSYCRRDDRENLVGRFVEAMTLLDLAPWLDMKAIPDRVATGTVEVDDDILEQILSDGIRQARTFVAVVGAAYLDSKYAMDEWNIARKAAEEAPDFVCLQVSLDGCRVDEPGAPVPIVARTPAKMARRIADAIIPVQTG